MHIEQQQESRVHTFSFLKGSQQASDSISLSQQQSGAESYLYGLYVLTQDQQNFTQQVHVDHIGTNGTSSMVYKGILDKKSRAAFHGKAYVHPETKNINAAQQNHHLLLSDQAEANSKPQLEIYAEDVKCTHGATVGRLNDEALFYLLTRGIEKNLARHLLIDGFAAEVYSKIKNPIIKEYIQHKMGHQHE